MKKPHINTILKLGANLKAVKLDANDAEVNRLIELTIKQQEEVLALTKIKPEVWQQVITI